MDIIYAMVENYLRYRAFARLLTSTFHHYPCPWWVMVEMSSLSVIHFESEI